MTSADGYATLRAEIERLNRVFARECDLTVDLRAEIERLRVGINDILYVLGDPDVPDDKARHKAWSLIRALEQPKESA